MATSRMNQNWLRIKTQILDLWSEADFEDKELKKARGNLRRMVDLIHTKTGEPKADIMRKLTAIV